MSLQQESQCPISGECAFAGICEQGDTSLVYDAVAASPEMQILAPELSKDELCLLVGPVLKAWDAEPCLREKVRSLKELQFQQGISHVSMTMGTSVLEKIDQVLGVS